MLEGSLIFSISFKSLQVSSLPPDCSISRPQSFAKILLKTSASSQARWWLKSPTSRAFATVSSLCLESSGSIHLDIGSVSIAENSNTILCLAAHAITKPVSKSALCATSTGLSPQNSINLRSAASSLSAPATISFEMPVSLVIKGVISRSGSTNISNLSTTSRFFILTAPISIIRSFAVAVPVVSRSKTIISSVSFLLSSPFIIMISSFIS